MPSAAGDIAKEKRVPQRVCKMCKYHVNMGPGERDIACYYAVIKCHSRGDPEGECTHFEQGDALHLNFNDREHL